MAKGTPSSPYISVTRSYGVARDFAIDASKQVATQGSPAFVYEITIEPSDGFNDLEDPIATIAGGGLGSPLDRQSYHHDGDSMFVIGVADPVGMRHLLAQQVQFPPNGPFATPRTPNLTTELEAMVRALRDAEILAFDRIPRQFVTDRFDVW